MSDRTPVPVDATSEDVPYINKSRIDARNPDLRICVHGAVQYLRRRCGGRLWNDEASEDCRKDTRLTARDLVSASHNVNNGTKEAG
jgi:hypothetical protein